MPRQIEKEKKVEINKNKENISNKNRALPYGEALFRIDRV